MANKDKHDYLHAATVHILDKSEATVGTGCYVGKNLIATCAHVIRSAVLGVDENIKFKFHHETDIFEGKLVSEFWRDPNKEDIAFIKVTSEHLKEVTPLKIGDGSYSSGHKIITVGYPFISDEYDVLWSEGYITGTLLHPQKGLMLQAKIPTIMRGMSGAPIYDVDSDFVIGFISEYLSNSDVVWITPSETLKEVNPAIVFKLPSDVSNYLDAFTKFAQNLPYVSIKSEKVIDQIYVRQIAKEANIVTKQLNKKNSNEAQPITDLFLNSKMVALIGIPGMGKSSLLRYILLHQSVFLTGNYLPLLASISGLVEKKGTLQYMLKAQLMDELGARLLLPIPDNFLGEWHDRTGMNWLIALDGLDEITNNTNRKLFIRELMRAPWPEGTVIVITSRPNEEIYLLDDFIHYELLPFSEEQIQAFASKWFSSKKRAKAFLSTIENQKLIETNSTPLMLTIAATIFENQQISQFNRSALYDSYIKQILEEDLNPHRQIYQQLINSVGITLGEKIFRHRRLLIEKIAYSAQSKKPNDKGLADQLNTNPFNIGNLDIQEILELVLEFCFRISLMVKRGNRIEFIHPTFREFLAASYIIRTSENNPDQIWKRLFSKWQNKYWTQTVIFGFLLLYHQGFDIETFISKIYDSSDEDFPNTSDVTKSNLFLGLLLSENIKIEYSTTSKVITALVNIVIDGKNNLDIGQALRILSQLNGEYPTIYLQLFELFKNRDFFSIEYNFTILDIMISYQWDSTYIKNIAIELEKGKLSKTHQAELIVRMIRIGFYDEAKDLLYILVQQFIRNQYSENHDQYIFYYPDQGEENVDFYEFVFEYYEELVDLAYVVIQEDEWDLSTRLWVANCLDQIEIWLIILFGGFNQKITDYAYKKVLDRATEHNWGVQDIVDWLLDNSDRVLRSKENYKLINLLRLACTKRVDGISDVVELYLNSSLSLEIAELIGSLSPIENSLLDLLFRLANSSLVEPKIRLIAIKSLVADGYFYNVRDAIDKILRDDTFPISLRYEIEKLVT